MVESAYNHKATKLFAKQRLDCTYLLSLSLSLSLSLQGVRAPQYNWTINDESLEEDTEDLKFNRQTGELTVNSATKFDEGTYTCEAYNKAGSDTAQVIVIIHIVANIVDQVNAVRVGLGSEAVLSVTLSASPPIDMVQWTSSSQTVPLTNSTKYTFDFSGEWYSCVYNGC